MIIRNRVPQTNISVTDISKTQQPTPKQSRRIKSATGERKKYALFISEWTAPLMDNKYHCPLMQLCGPKPISPMTLRETVCWAEPCLFRTTTEYEPASAGQAWEISTLLNVSLLLTDILGPPATTWRGGTQQELYWLWSSEWEHEVTDPTTTGALTAPCLCCKSSSRPMELSCSWTHSAAGPALLLGPPPAQAGLWTPEEVLRRSSLLVSIKHEWSSAFFTLVVDMLWQLTFSSRDFCLKVCGVCGGRARRWTYRCVCYDRQI